MDHPVAIKDAVATEFAAVKPAVTSFTAPLMLLATTIQNSRGSTTLNVSGISDALSGLKDIISGLTATVGP
jgi:hypothetical protein